MEVQTLYLELGTSGHTEIVDITNKVETNLKKTGLREGNVTVFVPGSTAALTTVEYEPGLVRDLKELFEKVVPEKGSYFHEEAWHDGNGYAHVRSSLLKPSLTIPFSEGKLLLGSWQQIVFIDFDNRSRKRRIVTQYLGN